MCRVMSQSGILYERLDSLERSRRGHLSTITKVCNALDETVKDFGNVVKVRTEQKQLNTAWEQYCACCDKFNKLTSVFLCVCPVIDRKFRHHIVKVAVDPRGDSRVDPQTTLTM